MIGRRRIAPLAADDYLVPYRDDIARRHAALLARTRLLTGGESSAAALTDWAGGHNYYGLHRTAGGWVFRDWAPNVTAGWLIGDATGWERRAAFQLRRLNADGDWELRLPEEMLGDGMHYLLDFEWPGGGGRRIPAWARYVVQDDATQLFSAKVFEPASPYVWRHDRPAAATELLVYEAHVGMATAEARVGGFDEFRRTVLPRIAQAGYNTLQLMAVMSHPYYGSFGYHVANFYSISGRFGTPDDFRRLVDDAHGLGLRVIIDLVHSHAVKNEVEGLARFDGTDWQYFHTGARGEHQGWDSRCFDYAKPGVLHFLLSNCRFWLEEYRLDGFRFDGVTSMLYLDHGLGRNFNGYADYFNAGVDEDAYVFLGLANTVIHTVCPTAVTVAEDVSGMAGLAAPVAEGGCGFDYRLAMGVTDYWFKLFDQPDENWNMGALWYELTNHRADERVISYVECHDQSIVGGQTAIFRLIGNAMYDAMRIDSGHAGVERGVALHKMARLLTAATGADGYLNFMGNEFGHPEWVDFPRAGNQWSCWYARRQWELAARPELRYGQLERFDRAMIHLLRAAGVYAAEPQLVRCDEWAKVVVFERGGLWFFVNFHPTQSLADWPCVARPGVYDLVLDSDAVAFGGQGRLAPEQTFHAQERIDGGELRSELMLYLPCRAMLVLRRRITATD